VVAWGNSSVHSHTDAPVILFSFAVAWIFGKSKAVKRSKTATIIRPKWDGSVGGWLNKSGITPSNGFVTLYKRVSMYLKAQESTPNETVWTPGKTLIHPNWNPKVSECGAGKFHACPAPYLCDEFQFMPDDRYVAIKIHKRDLFAWKDPEYTTKIAFRKGSVLYECDSDGKRIAMNNYRPRQWQDLLGLLFLAAIGLALAIGLLSM
jgi:hypothetical protein